MDERQASTRAGTAPVRNGDGPVDPLDDVDATRRMAAVGRSPLEVVDDPAHAVPDVGRLPSVLAIVVCPSETEGVGFDDGAGLDDGPERGTGADAAVLNTIDSLLAQRYRDLDIVAVAPAVPPSDGLAGAIDRLGERRVRVVDVGRDADWAGSVTAASRESGRSPFLLIVEPGTTLRPGAVLAMVQEAYRANAGIVGVKVVDDADPPHLVHAGAAVDRFGFFAPTAEPGELDQGQHDASRHVFCVADDTVLVRADLFDELGGFRHRIWGPSTMLDLCWRAQVAGARVVIMPGAVVARPAAATPRFMANPSELALRAQMVLGYERPARAARLALEMAGLSFLDAMVSLVTGRIGRFGEVVGAWMLAIARLPATGALRRRVARTRHRDVNLGRLQVRGSRRLATLLDRRDDRRGLAAVTAGFTPGPGSSWAGLATALGFAVFWLVGSRSLISEGVPALGQLGSWTQLDGVAGSWWSGWTNSGLGHASPLMTGTAVIAGATAVGPFEGLLSWLPALVWMPLGALGAWRLFDRLPERAPRVVATVVYAVNPLVVEALSSGRWQALVAYGFAPWILRRIGGVAGVPPFARRGQSESTIAHLGLVVGVGAAFAPVVALLAAGLAVTVLAGLVLNGRVRAAASVAFASLGALALAAVINLPVTLAFISRDLPLRLLADGVDQSFERVDLAVLASFGQVGRTAGWLVIGLLGPALLTVGIGRGWRARWAGVAWLLIASSWVTAALLERVDVPWRPPLVTMLVPAALGAAFAGGLAVAALQRDLGRQRFGWRQPLTVVCATGLVIGLVSSLLGAADGRWGAPNVALSELVSYVERPAAAGRRVAWLGRANLLPAASHPIGGPWSLAVTETATPTAVESLGLPRGPGDRQLADAVTAALDGRTTRLGASLASFGISLLVVPLAVGPAPEVDASLREDALAERLASQLDLQSEIVNPNALVYSIAGAVPDVADADPELVDVGTPLARAVFGSPGREPALGGRLTVEGAQGTLEANSTIRVASQLDDRWTLRVDGEPVDLVTSDGWAASASVSGGGAAELTRSAPTLHRFASALSILVLGLVSAWLVGLRSRADGTSAAEPRVRRRKATS